MDRFNNRNLRPKRWIMSRDAKRKDAGAVLVELSLVMIMLTTLALGLAEYGNLFGSAIDTSLGVRSAAAAGASTGETPAPDKAIIMAALDQRGGTKRPANRIVVYRANSTSAGPTQTCKTTLNNYVPGVCNVYFPADYGKTEAQIAALSAGGWPASTRVPGKDLIGVWVEMASKPIQSLVWSPNKFNDFEVMLVSGTVAPPDAGPIATDGFSPGPQSIAPFSWSAMYDWEEYNDTGSSSGGGGGSGSL